MLGITYPFFPPEENMYIVQECVFYLVFCIQNLFWNSLAVFVIWGYSCLPFFMAHSSLFLPFAIFWFAYSGKLGSHSKLEQYQLLSNSFANVCFLYDHRIICPAGEELQGDRATACSVCPCLGSQYRAGVLWVLHDDPWRGDGRSSALAGSPPHVTGHAGSFSTYNFIESSQPDLREACNTSEHVNSVISTLQKRNCGSTGKVDSPRLGGKAKANFYNLFFDFKSSLFSTILSVSVEVAAKPTWALTSIHRREKVLVRTTSLFLHWVPGAAGSRCRRERGCLLPGTSPHSLCGFRQ